MFLQKPKGRTQDISSADEEDFFEDCDEGISQHVSKSIENNTKITKGGHTNGGKLFNNDLVTNKSPFVKTTHPSLLRGSATMASLIQKTNKNIPSPQIIKKQPASTLWSIFKPILGVTTTFIDEDKTNIPQNNKPTYAGIFDRKSFDET